MCGIDTGASNRHHAGMGDVINLRQARKAKARIDRESEAARNRARFGRTKAEKAAEAKERARIDATLDGARRE